MSGTIGGIEVALTKANPNFHHWTEFEPSVHTLPQGWRREPGRRQVKEDMIWEKDVAIPMRDGIKLRADIFRPSRNKDQALPVLLPWSPYGKTGSGSSFQNRGPCHARADDFGCPPQDTTKLPTLPILAFRKTPLVVWKSSRRLTQLSGVQEVMPLFNRMRAAATTPKETSSSLGPRYVDVLFTRGCHLDKVLSSNRTNLTYFASTGGQRRL